MAPLLRAAVALNAIKSLLDGGGQATVFAPTNAAFTRVPAVNASTLTSVLGVHVALGYFPASVVSSWGFSAQACYLCQPALVRLIPEAFRNCDTPLQGHSFLGSRGLAAVSMFPSLVLSKDSFDGKGLMH